MLPACLPQVDYRAELAGPSCEGSVLPVVGVEDIEAIVAAWTSIPVERMSDGEKERLLNMVRGAGGEGGRGEEGRSRREEQRGGEGL